MAASQQNQPSFFDLIKNRIAVTNGSLLMVGLDCHSADLKEQTGAAAFDFCKRIIDETKHVAIGYKPNAAFFERLGASGSDALKKVIAYVPNDIPVLLDVKRGDIGSTCTAYAEAAYCELNASGVTLSAYMGHDAVAPFVQDKSKGVFLLCKTSNKTSCDLQTLRLEGGKEMLYERMARLSQEWNKDGNIGLVVGATDIEAMKRSRTAAPDSWILAPGVGAQGGDLIAALRAGLRVDGSGIIIPVSRGISRAENPKNAAENFADIMRTTRSAVIAERNQRSRCSSGRISSAKKELQEHQRNFIVSALEMKVLRFGSFTLKSGRTSPYFFNAGLFCSGASMSTLADAYAEAIISCQLQYDVIFGPAYKGIPLAACIAMSLSSKPGQGSVPWVYNRKEIKDHGEGGSLVGADLRGKRVLVVDDVITAGTAIRESIQILGNVGAKVSGVVVALDREEITSTSGEKSAIEALEEEQNVRVVSVATLSNLIEFVKHDKGELSQHLDKICAYRAKYGSKTSK
eukprot:g4293.t1